MPKLRLVKYRHMHMKVCSCKIENTCYFDFCFSPVIAELLQSGSVCRYYKVGRFFYKVRHSFVITKWDSFYYYKVGRFYYEVGRVLQSETGITKWDRYIIITKWDDFITKWDGYHKVGRFYYKVGQVLQSGTIITKCT